jgi:hypothetical protein
MFGYIYAEATHELSRSYAQEKIMKKRKINAVITF